MSISNTILKRGLVLALLAAAAVRCSGTELPDLARLKVAAESGEAAAQFEYGQRITFSNQKEHFEWLLKSAEQGYAPAQDAVAEHLLSRYVDDPKKKRASDREAVRWASRAAYQGLAAAQSRISGFYSRGLGVGQDPLKAFMWAQIAVQTSEGDRGNTMGPLYRSKRDGLMARTKTEIIAEGGRQAASFKPAHYGPMNPVEADLIFAELKLSAIYGMNSKRGAVVNNVRFFAGESKELKLDEHPVAVTCLDIESRAARFAIAGTTYQITLALEH